MRTRLSVRHIHLSLGRGGSRLAPLRSSLCSLEGALSLLALAVRALTLTRAAPIPRVPSGLHLSFPLPGVGQLS